MPASAGSVWFVTAASRGIGLALVKHLSASSSNVVIAACRNPEGSPKLQQAQKASKAELHVVTLDTGDEAAIKAIPDAVKEFLKDRGIDYLVNMAAITEGDDKAFSFSPAGFMQSMQVNVLGPALLAQALLPFLEKSKKRVIVNVTSGLASIGLNFGDKNATYSISKTALNMLTYKQATQRPDLIAFVVDPGWVKTDMGGPGAQIETSECINNLLSWIPNAGPERSGKFFNNKGERIPW
ncbi:sniffer [Neolentinus lepideus HHB14362 ss-1]|uniref:Sniffer n=1 Tax=Neolentinus lepideus HHB14362 ss-1 TaxID=1314782 RepID=A0A165S9I7_9AGAM|nr:sniffer [Neolentinus lepideus HHB14362 ss-1]